LYTFFLNLSNRNFKKDDFFKNISQKRVDKRGKKVYNNRCVINGKGVKTDEA